jgi:hypothetical protein
MGSFETSEQHPEELLRPLRVASLKRGIYEEAKDMVHDLPGWSIVREEPGELRLVCKRAGGLLSGESTVTIAVDGPDDIPSATVHVRSESHSGLVSRDKRNVLEFLKPFQRRVC